MNQAAAMQAMLRSASRAAQRALPLALTVLQGCASAPEPVPSAPVITAPNAQTPPSEPAATASAEKPKGDPRDAASATPSEPTAKDVKDAKDAKQAKAVPSVAPHLQAELDAAMGLVKAGQHEQAVDAFKKLAIALPDNPIPAINLALTYKKLDKLDLAQAQLKTALTLDPDNPVAGNELGLLYRATGQFAEARAVYEKTLARYPHFAMAHKNLGVLCDLYLKDYACAIDHYQSYASSAPNDKSVGVWIADLQKRTGTKERQ